VPIDYRIDHEKRLVVAEGRATVTAEDVFEYQRKVWSHAEVSGYDELIDMNTSEAIATGPQPRLRELADLSARSDPPDRWSRLAIVARSDVAFGVARQYQTYRQLNDRTRKEVAVFRGRQTALKWLSDRRSRDL
jgi:hypothetical protein